MSNPEIGKPAPDFEISATNNKQIKLADLKGKNVVIFFYPKDNTPGCTTESCDFRDNYKEFEKLNTLVFGISRDSLTSHENFKHKFDFPFELLSDSNEMVCQLYGVIKMKNMYGKKVRGIERSTFLIDKNGNLQREWRKVSVGNHVDEVLNAVKQLNLG
jgi:peroxiredoxin Q/BCP